MEIYYAIVNILDYLASYNVDTMTKVRMFCILDKLAEELVKAGLDDNIQEVIASTADANDAGGSITWVEIVESFKEQYRNGNRVPTTKEKIMKDNSFTVEHLARINAECKGNMYLEIMKIAADTLAAPDELRDFAKVIWSALYEDLKRNIPLYVGISESDYTINIGNFDEENNIEDTRWFVISMDENEYVSCDEIAITKKFPHTESELISYLCKILMGIEDVEDLVKNVDCVVEEKNSLIIKYMNGTMTRLQITNLDKENENVVKQKRD